MTDSSVSRLTLGLTGFPAPDSFATPSETPDISSPGRRFGHQTTTHPTPPELFSPSQLDTEGVTSHARRQRLEQQRNAERRSILQTLLKGGFGDLADGLPPCRDNLTHRRCNSCGQHSTFWDHCDLLWCPNCQRRLAARRRESVEFWALQIRWPMHLVLTVRNRAHLNVDWIAHLKRQLTKLRRSKVFRGVKGGLWSLEMTNESKGWHVHFHLLLDCQWLDMEAVSQRWASLTDQDMVICRAKRCHNREYLKEVCKYAVKGSTMAHWPATEIAQFIVVMHSNRTFGTFGSLHKARSEWTEYQKAHATACGECDCGSSDFSYYNEQEWEVWEIEHELTNLPPPPPTTPRAAATPTLPLAFQPDFRSAVAALAR